MFDVFAFDNCLFVFTNVQDSCVEKTILYTRETSFVMRLPVLFELPPSQKTQFL